MKKKLFATAIAFAVVGTASANDAVAPSSVAEKKVVATYVSTGWLKGKHYSCKSGMVLVFDANGSVQCRPENAQLIKPGEKPFVSDVVASK